ncbi:MAG: HAMP domain-containing histidine kinase [Fimbriimonadaceae bacterium]|nr:HAMP domain-containing histidine kinase [Fimbriimonadaceae bacterium]
MSEKVNVGGNAIQSVETAQRMLEMIHDLGECQDARQILVAALRHYRFLFGEYKGMILLLDDPKSGNWRSLGLESPYGQSWGGISHNMLPENSSTDQIGSDLGKDATPWITNDPPFRRAFVESSEGFVAHDGVLAVRLATFTGLNANIFWAASWRRPGGSHAWSILAFDNAHAPNEERFGLYCTAVETTSRMAYYPSLLQSVARTERINQSIRRNIVHDLKTPITVIKGYAETLREPEIAADPEIVEELFNGIVESCDRLLADIKDIIEPIEGEWKPTLEEFDLAMMLHKVVLAERHTERSKHHNLVLQGADEPVMVCGDRRKLMRVVENLLSNAVKYSPGLNKNVWVKLTHYANRVMIEVQDEGLGLSQDQVKRVLDDCQRVVDESLGIEGSGFGLNSCQLVLKAHGGKLEVDSEQGVGSVFRAILQKTLDVI